MQLPSWKCCYLPDITQLRDPEQKHTPSPVLINVKYFQSYYDNNVNVLDISEFWSLKLIAYVV